MLKMYICLIIRKALLVLIMVVVFYGSSGANQAPSTEDDLIPSNHHPRRYIESFGSSRPFIPLLKYYNATHQITSTFIISEQEAVPDSAGWSRCQHCALTDSLQFAMWSPQFTNVQNIVASWSQWNEFFYQEGNDVFRLRKESSETLPVYLINNPVYVVPMIAFHPGHFLIDVYEQIYHSMMKTYGMIRKDSLIILDVAAPHQRPYYHKYVANLVNEAGPLDNLYSLIRSFTDLPIMTHEILQDILLMGDKVLFADVHIALDNSQAHYYRGYRYHPYPLNPTLSMTRDFDHFQRHLRQYINEHHIPSTRPRWEGVEKKAFLVTKSRNRVVANQQDVVRTLQALNYSVLMEDLSELTFHEQISIFAEVDVFVAVAGTAVHNALFMKPSAVVVVVMQPLWCQHSWMYINQLRLLGLNHSVICSSSTDFKVDAHLYDNVNDGDFYLGVYRKAWTQGPRVTKLHSIAVDLTELHAVLLPASMGSENNVEIPTRIDHGVVDQDVAAIQLVVSNIEFPEDQTDSGSVQEGQVKIWYDFVGPWEQLNSILQSTSELSVCNIMPLAGEQEAVCFSVETMNYFAGLKMMMLSSAQHTFLFQFWIQLSVDGGKVRHSDLFVPVETRLRPGGGLGVVDWAVNRTLQFSFSISNHEVGGQHLQGLIVDTLQYDLFRTYAADSIPLVASSDGEGVQRVQLQLLVENQYTLQRQLPGYCRRYALLDSNCALLVQSLHRYLAQWQLIEQLALPAVQHAPSPDRPFVFLHVDKTGGTTLRDFIVNSTSRLAVKYFIPCYNEVSCMTFDVEDDRFGQRDYSAIAGHFFWNVWKTLHTTAASVQPSCFVMTRDPVQRIVSLYNQRYFSEAKSAHYQRPVNTFSAEEWERVLIFQRFARVKEDNETIIIVDEGMSDAACRAILNLRTTTGLVNPSSIEVPAELTPQQTKQAIENVQQCVVGVLEQWEDTVRVVNHWFPWISFDNNFGRQLNQGSKGDKSLREELVEVTIRNNPCDVALHQAMLERFEEQKKVIDSDYFAI